MTGVNCGQDLKIHYLLYQSWLGGSSDEDEEPARRNRVRGGNKRNTVTNSLGLISGPGTGTSDSIPASLSNGEFVVNKKATSENLGLLQSINFGGLGFANGGLVGNIIGGLNDSSGGFSFSSFFKDGKFDAEAAEKFVRLLDLSKEDLEEALNIIHSIGVKTLDNSKDQLGMLDTISEKALKAKGIIQTSFFDEKDIKAISGSLSSGMVSILTGKSQESIGAMFKRVAKNYLDKYFTETITSFFDKFFESMFSGANNAISGSNGSGGVAGLIGSIFGFNKGGYVPGTGNRDTVPAMLTPGELVLTKKQQTMMGGGVINIYNTINAPLGVDENVSRFIAQETERTIANNPRLINNTNNVQNRRDRTFGGR